MSFTQDELQSLHTIVEQKLSVHRQELERAFDLRINVLKRELESNFVSILQDQMRNLPQRILEHQDKLKDALNQRMDVQQMRITQALSHELEQQQQQLALIIERVLAAQRLDVEQLVRQHSAPQSNGHSVASPLVALPIYETRPNFEAIEIQTEISWDDLVDAVGKALDERLTVFDESLRSVVKNIEHRLSLQIHNVREILGSEQTQALNGAITNLQSVFTNFEQLEHLVEAMQVALTANHALLSNRLYHHQHLPLERAHASNHESAARDVKNQLSPPEEGANE